MAKDRRPWLGRALYWQSAIVTILIGCFCVIALLGFEFSLVTQLIVLLGGIVLVGFPHGAFDHLVARPILAGPLGRWWGVVFVVAYCSLAGVVLLAWIWVPQMTLAAFLSATVLHFGLGDADDGLAPATVPRTVTVLTYGSFPLLLPVVFHASQAAPVLAAMANMTPEALLPALYATRWLLPIWVAAFIWVTRARLKEHSGIAERLMTATGFVILPPLLSFGLYFGFGHSTRHVLRLCAWHDPYMPNAALRWALQVIVPASVGCGIGLVYLSGVNSSIAVGVVAQGFQIIAALTFPHMIVTSWLSQSESGDRGQ